jgi:hypothetical protein
MPEEIMDKLIIARDIGVKIIIGIILLYLLYRVIDYILRRRETTLEVIVNSLYNYESYIQIDSNIAYLGKFVSDVKVFNQIKGILLEEQSNFKVLIDKYIRRKGFDYHIFCEYKESDTDIRNSKLLIVNMSILGKIKSYKIIDKNGNELQYLQTI